MHGSQKYNPILFKTNVSGNQDPMADYLGKTHALFHEFNELLPFASTLA